MDVVLVTTCDGWGIGIPAFTLHGVMEVGFGSGGLMTLGGRAARVLVTRNVPCL